MKKQINYPKLVPRLFATTIDLFILSIVSSPVMSVVSQYAFMRIFSDFFTANNIDPTQFTSIAEIAKMPEFISFATTHNNGITYFLIFVKLCQDFHLISLSQSFKFLFL